MTLIARFTVEGAQPTKADGIEADWVGMLIFTKTFTAGIVGGATTLFMSAGTEEGQRSYVATDWTGSARIQHDADGAYFEIELS